MVKCYFNHCPNTDCQEEVATGISMLDPKRFLVFNPVCPSCIRKTDWRFLVTRPLGSKDEVSFEQTVLDELALANMKAQWK